MHLETLFPRGRFQAVATSAAPVDVSTQSSGNAGDPVYVKSIVIAFRAAPATGATVTLRNSAASEDFLVVAKSAAALTAETVVLDNFSFYAAGGLEITADAVNTADVSIVFFDTNF